MKPIEKGCLAIIIKSKAGNEGKIVIIGNFIGSVEGFLGNDYWETDIALPSLWGYKTNIVLESYVMRIDGYEGEEELEEENALVDKKPARA